jgi:hypothetical protein
MTLKVLIRKLRRTVQRLAVIDRHLASVEVPKTTKLMHRHKSPSADVFADSFNQRVLQNLIADTTTVTSLVATYQVLLSGSPLCFNGIDAFSKSHT